MTATEPANDNEVPAIRADLDGCHVCGTRLGAVRRSARWGFDVGTCLVCGTVSVVGASRAVPVSADEAGQTETDWDVYSARMHVDDPVRSDVLRELRTRLDQEEERSPLLFDVGAGTGAFLDMARDAGFEIAGNDISSSAIRFAADRYGIALSPDGLDAQPPRTFDAVTMWCVIAHVEDPHAFLADAMHMLRPGGVLFLRTPRWCGIDRSGAAVARATRGRLATLLDQRITPGHLHLYRDGGMERMLTSIGFVDIEVRPVAHTGCTGTEIASRLGGPRTLQRWSARLIDRAVAAGVAPRNTMFVFARRPL